MDNELKSRMMSPEEILNQKLTEPSMISHGLKKRFPDETSDEIVSRLQDDLLKLISYERVERSIARSQAEYNAITGLVVVTRKVGKWHTFGYRTKDLDCLKYYEALYLIDINRLELYYDSVLVSLEQAYALLLNNKHDPKSHEKYFIYSNLSKAGYNVQPHRKHIQLDKVSIADKCVWRCLFEDLNQPTSSKDNNQESDELYLKTRENMKNIENAIRNQHAGNVMDEGLTDERGDWQIAIDKVKSRKDYSRKRKMEMYPLPSTSKKISKSHYTTDRFLDVLTYEEDVCNFREIFDEIQVVQLDQIRCDNVESSDIEFDFDLYLAQPSFRQSDPGPPNFRILIFKSNEQPPTREMIVKAFLKPAVPAPVLVFYVNELMRRNYIHFERLICNSYPGTNAAFVRCQAKHIDRNNLKIDVLANLTRPIEDVWLRGAIYYKYNTYQKIGTEIWDNFCDWIAGKRISIFLDFIKPILLTYTNLYQKCPYNGMLFLKVDNISLQNFAFPHIAPAGRYRIDYNFTKGDRKTVFGGFSTYGSISDHRIEVV